MLQKRKLLAVLAHAFQCKACPCSNQNCFKIRRLFQHAKKCTSWVRGDCQQCTKGRALLILHSRNCTEPDCRIPHCMCVITFIFKSFAWFICHNTNDFRTFSLFKSVYFNSQGFEEKCRSSSIANWYLVQGCHLDFVS